MIHRLLSDLCDQKLDRYRAGSFKVLLHRRQPVEGKLPVEIVVGPGDRQVIRNAQPFLKRGGKDAEGGNIIRADNRVGPRLHAKEAFGYMIISQHRAVTVLRKGNPQNDAAAFVHPREALAPPLEEGVIAEGLAAAKVPHGMFKAFNAVPGGPGVVIVGQQQNPPMPDGLEVPGHALSMLLPLMEGRVSKITADLRNIKDAGDAEDHAFLFLRTDRGMTASVTVTSVCALSTPRWRILGSHGTLQSDGLHSTLRYYDPGALASIKAIDGAAAGRAYQTEEIPWKQEVREVTATPAAGSFYDNVHDVVRNGSDMMVSVDDALEIMRVIHLAHESGRA